MSAFMPQYANLQATMMWYRSDTASNESYRSNDDTGG